MAWQDLFTAIALVLVIEGLLPFANPGGWRRTLQLVSSMEDTLVRRIGLASIAAGLLLLYVVR